MHACVQLALRKDVAIALQHCEKVMQWCCRIAKGATLQWFVSDVPNIAETLICSIAKGVQNCSKGVQKSPKGVQEGSKSVQKGSKGVQNGPKGPKGVQNGPKGV